MAEGRRMTAAQAVDKLMASEHADVIRESVRLVVAELMEAEVAELVGAELGERAPERRTTQRNGYRERSWDTRVGELELAIPKLRSGPAYFPIVSGAAPARRAGAGRGRPGGLRQRRLDPQGRPGRRAARGADEQGPGLAAVPRASTSRSRRSASGRWRAPTRTCGSTPSRRRCATARTCVSKALVIAYGVHETGRREVIGLDVGEIESEAFWREFLRSLRRRGLDGVRAVRLRQPRGAQERDRPGARLPVAALHGALRSRHAPALPPAPARARLRRAARGLQRRRPRPGARARDRGDRAARADRAEGRRAAARPPRRTCSRSTASPPSTGASCAARTRSSASTARSAAAPTSSASSPTTPR